MKPGSTFLFYFDIFMVLLQMGFWISFYYSINQKIMSTKKMYNDFRNKISCEFYIFTFCVKKDESHTSLKLRDDSIKTKSWLTLSIDS